MRRPLVVVSLMVSLLGTASAVHAQSAEDPEADAAQVGGSPSDAADAEDTAETAETARSTSDTADAPAATPDTEDAARSTSASDTDSGLSETGVILSRELRVRSGDSFLSIARREFGTARYATALAEFNELDLNEPLSVGQRVRIPIMVPSRNEAANVIFVKGDARRNGRRIQPNERIRRGDTIVTGDDGFLTIEFSNGTVVNLQPETRATLKRLNCVPSDDSCFIELRSESGTFSSDVENRPTQPTEFRITTPFAAAAVRGTDFEFHGDADVMRVGVTEGQVDISAQRETVALDEGFGSRTQAGQPPGAATPLLPPPVFRNVPPRVSTGDRVRWWELSDAARYAATLSIDSQGLQTIADYDTDATTLDLSDAIPGNYYLNLQGIDPSGIPGFFSSTLITVADVDTDVAPPVTRAVREGETILVEVIDPSPDAQGFEIQLSVDPDFADPLIADVGPTGNARFASDEDVLYTRARQLFNPQLVSAFGRATSTR